MPNVIPFRKSIVWTCGCGYQQHFIHIKDVGPIGEHVSILEIECGDCGKFATLTNIPEYLIDKGK